MDENQIPNSCHPGSVKCSATGKNNLNPLRYTAYYPLKTVHNYNSRPLPVVVLFHAGGYSDCSGIDNDTQNQTVAQSLARKGFIAISAEYRRGIIVDTTNLNDILTYPQGFTTAQQELAGYRAQQDGKGALRSIMQRQLTGDGHENKFTFSVNQFFVGGFSAGAGIANGICYYKDQAMINQAFPKANTSLDIEATLGSLQADYYYGSTAAANMPTIRGLMNCWGGIAVPSQYETNVAGYLGTTGYRL